VLEQNLLYFEIVEYFFKLIKTVNLGLLSGKFFKKYYLLKALFVMLKPVELNAAYLAVEHIKSISQK
jgi:hypothetical protein